MYKGKIEEPLHTLNEQGAMIAALSDVAYGMENKYALNYIKDIVKYIDLPLHQTILDTEKLIRKDLSIF